MPRTAPSPTCARQSGRTAASRPAPTSAANAQATAWASAGLLAAGKDPAGFGEGRSSFAYMRDLQTDDGYFLKEPSLEATPIWVTADVLVPLTGNHLPSRPPQESQNRRRPRTRPAPLIPAGFSLPERKLPVLPTRHRPTRLGKVAERRCQWSPSGTLSAIRQGGSGRSPIPRPPVVASRRETSTAPYLRPLPRKFRASRRPRRRATPVAVPQAPSS